MPDCFLSLLHKRKKDSELCWRWNCPFWFCSWGSLAFIQPKKTDSFGAGSSCKQTSWISQLFIATWYVLPNMNRAKDNIITLVSGRDLLAVLLTAFRKSFLFQKLAPIQQTIAGKPLSAVVCLFWSVTYNQMKETLSWGLMAAMF